MYISKRLYLSLSFSTTRLHVDVEAIAQFRKLQALVRAIRNARAEYKVGREGGREGGREERRKCLPVINATSPAYSYLPPSLPPSLPRWNLARRWLR